jgi:hypothetical protein
MVKETPEIKLRLTCNTASITPNPAFTPASRLINYVLASDSSSIYTFPDFVTDPTGCFTRETEIVDTQVEGVPDPSAIVFAQNCN